MGRIVIDKESCKGCSICMEVCPKHLIHPSSETNAHGVNFAEFKVSPGLNLEKGYLDGRFGAIPLLHHNLNWRKYGKKNT